MKPLIFDLETNGLLDKLDRIHLLAIKDMETGEVSMFRRNEEMDTIEEGIKTLISACHAGRIICGHNVIKFDIPAIRKVYPQYRFPHRQVRDTLVWAKLIWPDGLWDTDKKMARVGKLPKHLMNNFSLEAFGRRLGNFKGDYSGSWESWNQEMEDYCEQDVHVGGDLWANIAAKERGGDCIELEHSVAFIIRRQVDYGFLFDTKKASILYRTLVTRKAQLEEELVESFGSLYFLDGPETTPSRTTNVQQEQLGLNQNDPIMKGRGSSKYVAGYRYHTFSYHEGTPHQKVKLVQFNPTSRDHIAIWLKKLYRWKPTEFTPEGKPKVDETVMVGLPYPEAPKLKEYLLVVKRIAQVAEGKEAWLHHVQPDGRIHGELETNGAVTGRMTHKKPNMGQVPATYSPYGHDCRELFYVPKGKKLVGCDASALELCMFAGYLGRYDGGAYMRVVMRGTKEDGTDIHSVNARALGLDPKAVYFEGVTGRDIAKTWFYAFLYGAGAEKLGNILTQLRGKEAILPGSRSKLRFLESLPALEALINDVVAVVKERGYLVGLDGRRIPVRSPHSALNTLLQSAGAIIMKRALVILDESLQEAGMIPGTHYEFVANVHDEWQIEADEDKAEAIGQLAKEAIRKAGEFYKFRCPLSGDYNVGTNWAETH